MDEHAFSRVAPRFHGKVDAVLVRQVIEAYLAEEPRLDEYIDTDVVYRKIDDLTLLMEKRGRAEMVICRTLRDAVARLIQERDANVDLIERAKADGANLRQKIYDAETAYMERLTGLMTEFIETGTVGTKALAMKIVSEMRALRSPPP